MTNIAMNVGAEARRSAGAESSALRQRFWRWHFFAGILVIPFIVLLATTGSIYLFKPQIDAFEEHRIHRNATLHSATQVAQADLSAEITKGADELLGLLLSEYPDASLVTYTLAKSGDRTVEIVLNHPALDGTENMSVTYWVDQYTGNVLAQKNTDERFLSLVKKLHSELLMGNKGSYVVELIASWAIILLITGVYLWVTGSRATGPGKRSKILMINWSSLPKTLRWRDLHGVIGFWLAVPLLLILMSGLPWTQLWGSNYKSVIEFLGWDGPGQEWFVTLRSSLPEGVTEAEISDLKTGSLWEISDDHHHEAAGALAPAAWQIPISMIAEKEEVRSLVAPINIMPPKPNNGVWSVRSMPGDRSERVTLHYDQYSAEQIMRIDFDDHHPFERFVSSGISFHEGALFGAVNQALVLVTALSTTVLAFLGAYIWWRRRPKGALAAPARGHQSLSVRFMAGIVALGMFLPAAGISILVILVLEVVWSKCGVSRVFRAHS